MLLRYYQEEAKDAVEWGWEADQRLGVKLPTGAGKTVMVAKLIEDLAPARCLFIADQDELCDQPRRVFQKAAGIISALEKARDHASLEARVVVGSSQSMVRKNRLERYPRDHFQYIISDEVHRGTERDRQIWDWFSQARVLGMTATPYRADLADLSKWLSAMAYEMDILDLVQEGFAPPPLILPLPVEINVEAIKVKRGLDGKEYDAEGVASAIQPYYEEIANLLVEHAKDRKLIVYLPLIRSSQEFALCLRNAGLRAHHVDGNSENRDELIEGFSRGEFSVLCNSNLLSTGVDIPIADAFLNLRLTNSRAWYQQARGRVMRVLPNVIDHLPEKEQALERRQLIAQSAKPNSLIFDLLLQHDKLGTVHAGDDFAGSEHDAKALFEKTKGLKTPQEIEEISRWVKEERENALIAALERNADRIPTSQPLAAEQAMIVLGWRDLVSYVPVQRWEQDQPTGAQLGFLRSRGIDASSIKSKGAASKVIQTLSERNKLGYGTLKQVRLARQLNERLPLAWQIPEPEMLSFEEISRKIDQAMKTHRRLVA